MLVGINKEQRIEITSKHDTSEPKTVFVFRPMTGAEMVDIGGFGPEVKLSGDMIVDFITRSLIEVKNFDGQTDIKEIVECLPANILTELVESIVDINNLTKDDEKN